MDSELASARPLQTSRFGWLSVTVWSGLTLLGFLAAAVLHFPGDGDPNNLNLPGAVFGFVLGAISGLVTALLQLLVLKPWLRSPWTWLVVNGIGWGLVHAVNDGIGLQPQLAIGLAALLVAIPQYFALRHSLTNALVWPAVAAISWFLGFQMGHTLFNGEDPGNLLAAGLVVGITTGMALRALLLPGATTNNPFP